MLNFSLYLSFPYSTNIRASHSLLRSELVQTLEREGGDSSVLQFKVYSQNSVTQFS